MCIRDRAFGTDCTDFIPPPVVRICNNHTQNRVFAPFFTMKTITATWGTFSCFRTRQFHPGELFFPRFFIDAKKEFEMSSKEFRDKRNYDIFNYTLYFRCFWKFRFPTWDTVSSRTSHNTVCFVTIIENKKSSYENRLAKNRRYDDSLLSLIESIEPS